VSHGSGLTKTLWRALGGNEVRATEGRPSRPNLLRDASSRRKERRGEKGEAKREGKEKKRSWISESFEAEARSRTEPKEEEGKRPCSTGKLRSATAAHGRPSDRRQEQRSCRLMVIG
jgi:hypothetical protein